MKIIEENKIGYIVYPILCEKCGCAIVFLSKTGKEVFDELLDKKVYIKTFRITQDERFDYNTGANRIGLSQLLGNQKTHELEPNNRFLKTEWKAEYVKDYFSRRYTLKISFDQQKYFDENIIVAEEDKDEKCPLCGGNLIKLDGVHYEDANQLAYDSHNHCKLGLIQYLKILDYKRYFKNVKDENTTSSFKKLYNILSTRKLNSFVKSNEEKNFSPKKIKSEINVGDYLENIVNIEKNIIFLKEEYLKVLEKVVEYELEINKFTALEQRRFKLPKITLNVKKPVMPIEKKEPKKPIKPIFDLEKPILNGSGFFKKIEYNQKQKEYLKKLEEFKQEEKKYDDEMIKYNKKLEIFYQNQSELKKYQDELDLWNKKYDKALEKYFTGKLDDVKIELDFYKKIQNDIESNLSSLYDYKNKLLSLKVIFPKYNNLEAWTTMLEYFKTGRVDGLTGANGAYNLYENEERANLIITHIDNLGDKLDEIKENQYILLSTMKEINNNIKNIDDKTNKIEFNTAMSAYYDKLNNEKLKAIEFLSFLGLD